MALCLFPSLRRWLVAVVAVIAVAASASAAPLNEKWVALVIGVDEYQDARHLDNAVNDARAVERALKGLGFKVRIETDRSKRDLAAALDKFVQDSKGADLALVFYGGHGVQVAGRNFLLTTDTKTDSAAALEASSLPLDELFARLAEVAPRRIILLDACRNDPFGAVTAGGRGLAAREDPARPIVPGLGRIGRADGTVYAFATAPGQTASDGDGNNSPFTAALVAKIGTVGLEFNSIMKLVQMEVYERSRGAQLPYIEDALPGVIFVDTKGEPLPERDRLLLAMANIDTGTRLQVERIASAKDMPLAPLFGALLSAEAQLGRGDADAREKRLARAAEDFIKVRNDLRTLASSDPEVARLRVQAERALSLGIFEGARAALTQAIEVDRMSGERLEARLKERNLSEAATRAARAGVARTQLQYRVAAADFSAAADLAERWEKLVAWGYRNEQANNLYAQGHEFGDNNGLVEAIAVHRQAFALAPRAERPLYWAATQNNLGNALEDLGERESGTARLEEAVVAYRAALSERTRERVPLDWAMTQNNLGNALENLGERESGTARLEEAVVAYRAALSERTRERVPLDWAMTQNNLGIALASIGQRESGTARLDEAVAAFRAALSERTRERVPPQWAMTQNNLGAALQTLGERENGAVRLEEAVAAYRAALSELTRERMPFQWAQTVYNWANVEMVIAERSNPQERQERLTRGRQLAADALAVYGQANAQFYVAHAERLLAHIDAELAKASR